MLKKQIRRIVKNNKILYFPISLHYKRLFRIRNKYLHHHGYEVNELIYNLLSDRILYYAWAGTLLGIVRDKGFISHDDDIDYVVRISSDEDWKLIYDILVKAGFTLAHFFIKDKKVTELAFEYGPLQIDFFQEQKKNDNDYIEYYYRDRSRLYSDSEESTGRVFQSSATSFEQLIINDSHFIIPSNYEEYLVALYGNDWNTPVKGLKGGDVCGKRVFFPNEIALFVEGRKFSEYYQSLTSTAGINT